MEQLVGNVTEVNRAIDRVLRIFAWVLPALTIIYGALIMLDMVSGVPVKIPAVYYGLSVVVVSMAFLQQRLPVTKRSGTVTYLVIYHLCVAVGMFFVYGMNTPMMLLWGILSLITVIYFGILACTLSLVALAAVFVVYKYTIGFTASWFSINLITCYLFLASIAVIYAYLQAETYKKQEKLMQARNEERAQRKALLTTINSTTQAMFTLSSTGRVVLYNSALLALLDTNTSPAHKMIAKIMPLQYEDGKKFDYLAALKDKQRFSSDELIYKLTDNDQLNIRLDVSRVFDEETQKNIRMQQFVCTARDITKEKSLEEERDEFISVVSHELRTPITIAEGAISNAMVLADRCDPSSIQPAQEGLKLAHNQITFLAHMINDLSTLSRAERGVSDVVEQIDVKELGHKLFQNYTTQASEKGLTLNLDLGTSLGSVTTSRLYLEELLQNFLTNAVKYTREGSITLAVSRQGSTVRFAVTDTGIGVSKADQSKIFKKFYRSEDYRTRETGGTGLGLYVASKLARKIGTEIEIKSRLNHGSTFSITLPQSTSTSGKLDK
jgi:signal transduction histidine kinase